MTLLLHEQWDPGLPPPACFPHTRGTGSRIDFVMANRVAFTGVQDLTLVQDSGLPTHIPLQVTLRLAAYSQRILRVVRPLPYPVAEWPKWSPDRTEALAEACFCPFELRWNTALATSSVEDMWACFGETAEAYMEQRSAGVLEKPPRRYLGRGRECPP